MSKRSRSDQELKVAVKNSFSYRNVIILLGLVPAGGNYDQVRRRIENMSLSTVHFKGKGWNKDLKITTRLAQPLEEVLIVGSKIQSFNLKNRLYLVGLKKPKCELCGWAQKTIDGRIPVELDHINGDKEDNRIENLRILCPNCHSLQATHRGKNKGVYKHARVL